MAKAQPTNSTASFEVFRYQLLVDKTLPINMFEKYETADQIRADKNNILQRVLTNEKFRLKGGSSELTSKFLYTDGVMTYYRLGVKRSTTLYSKDLSPHTEDTYPNMLIAFNNDPDVQKIAIQTNPAAFKEIKTVSNIIQETLEEQLRQYNLSFYTEPIYDKKEFWNLVRKYPKQIKQVTFDLISPNMATISKNLQLNLKQLYEDTNTHKTKVQLNADKDGYLEIKEESKFVNSLVDYSADGGGNISIGLNGKRKLLHTAQSPEEFNIDKHLIEGNVDFEKLNAQFKNILI
ncbi:hypothetical protein HRH25_12780 [Flavisolibacter sp. BT320]|nr:hypothetical protein [Flavisolibacter longurius]